jgi:Holliday junction DNA helicase RuvA
MIASIHGIIASKTPESLIVEVGGIGYHVFIPLTTFYRLPEVKAPITLHIHTYVREDALQLYGFLSLSEKQLFLLLISVSGVGPKLARNILSGMEVIDLLSALTKGSAEQLRSIPGIGPKMAARLVLELKEKAASLGGTNAALSQEGDNPLYEDALSALINLGYKEQEARRTLNRVLHDASPTASPSSFGVEELIKHALQILVN